MALCSNGARFFNTGVRRFGAAPYLSAYPSVLQGNVCQAGPMRNLTAGEAITSELVGLPSGVRHPAAWMMPQKAGALAARNTIEGSGGLTLTLVAGVNAAASLTGSGSLTATGALIVSLVAALSGSGTITNASAVAFLQLAATLAGGGDLNAAASALAHAAAALSGSGTASATIRATGTLAADISASGELLTAQNVGAAVWARIVEAGYSAEQILRLLAAHAAGAATGLEGANPQFTGLDGTTLRIDGTYSAGARTIDALDVD